MTDRLPSGDSKLDDVLGGGLPTNSITVVAGAPEDGLGSRVGTYTNVFGRRSR